MKTSLSNEGYLVIDNLKNSDIIFRHFGGNSDYGDRRSFGLVIPEALAVNLKDDGWNVKESVYRDEVQYILNVYVDFDKRYRDGGRNNRKSVDKIWRKQNGKFREITEENVRELDERGCNILYAWVQLAPSPAFDTRKGVVIENQYNNPYLHSMVVEIAESEFDRRWGKEIYGSDEPDEVPFN